MIEAGTMTTPNAISIRLRRHRDGVKVFVKVAQEVEDFFKRWGGEVTEPPTFGRLWKAQPGDSPILVWHYNQRDEQDHHYSLMHTGRGFWTDDGTINLSFIRLVGASKGQMILCDTVISRTELDSIAAKLCKAAEKFYAEYIQSVDVSIFVGVRDMRTAGAEPAFGGHDMRREV